MVLPLVGTDIFAATAKRITCHEVTAPCGAGPSGRTLLFRDSPAQQIVQRDAKQNDARSCQ